MSRDQGLAFKVGAFVLTAVGVLTFFIISVSDLSFFQKGYPFVVVFNFASGLREAAPVRLAGVEVGLVKKLDVVVDNNDGHKMKVQVKLWIGKDVAIPLDSTITINQLGILGEKYVEIMPGVSLESIGPHTVLVGHDPVPIEKITERVDTLMTQLQVTVDSINNGVLTAGNKHALQEALEGFGVLGMDLKKGQGTFGKLLTDESIFNNLDDLTADLKSNPWKLLYRPKS